MNDPTTKELLERVVTAMQVAGVEYAIGGAMAMAAHGYSRSTKDVDLFVEEKDRLATLRTLRQAGLVVAPIFDPHHYVAHVPGTEDFERRIDVLVPAGEPELSAIEWSDVATVEGISDVHVFPVALLVMAKSYSDRAKDEQDIAAMLDRGLFDPEGVATIIETVDPPHAKRFRAMIRKLTAPRPKRKRPTKRLPKKD